MSLTVESVQALFAPLVAGDAMAFFTNAVDEHVVWTIGAAEHKTCILSGRHEGIHATAAALAQLAPFFSQEFPARTSIQKIHIAGPSTALVQLATQGTSTAGFKLDDRAVWVCEIVDGRLKEVENYCDTAQINELVAAHK